MTPEIYRLGLGVCNCFLIRDEGRIFTGARARRINRSCGRPFGGDDAGR